MNFKMIAIEFFVVTFTEQVFTERQVFNNRLMSEQFALVKSVSLMSALTKCFYKRLLNSDCIERTGDHN